MTAIMPQNVVQVVKVLNNLMHPLHIYYILHYDDVIMSAMASQITILTIVHSTVYLDTDQRKHQHSESLAFVRGSHQGPVNSTHKWPVTRKMFPFHNVIMGNTFLANDDYFSFCLISSVFSRCFTWPSTFPCKHGTLQKRNTITLPIHWLNYLDTEKVSTCPELRDG